MQIYPSILWFSNGWSKLPQITQNRQNNTSNHDYIFHTLLHILDINTKDYEKRLDILGCIRGIWLGRSIICMGAMIFERFARLICYCAA